MQNQFQTSSEVTSLPLYSTQFSAAELGDIESEQNAHVQARVEDYLDRVCQPLIDTVSYAKRTELRCELAQHIHALVQAYQEMGDSSVAATEKALAKFGQPEKVASQWKPLLSSKTRRVSLRRWFGRQWQGIASTLAVCSVMGMWFAISRPVLGKTSQSVSQQVTTQQGTQTTLAPNNFTHQSVMNVECSSCHRSTAQITVEVRNPDSSPQITAPK